LLSGITFYKRGIREKQVLFLFLAPFFGVLSGWLILREELYPSILIGGLFIIIGIYLVNRNFQQKKIQLKIYEKSQQ
jgi:probable blue pigment (indigoidine) exporter